MTLLWISLVFITVVGACIGSFLNVVVYRLPESKSVVTPPSSCPECGHRLAWYDNVPVLGWLWLRGKCRYCATPISPQYPVVEALTALLFGGWFYIGYFTSLRPQFAGPGFEPTALIFLAYLVLIGSLLAATLIDAKHYIIPLQLPWIATAAAIVLIPTAVVLFPRQAVVRVELPRESASGLRPTDAQRRLAVREVYRNSAEVRVAIAKRAPGPVEISAAPILSKRASAAAFGGALGLLVAVGLLHRRLLPRSFEQDVETIPQHALDPDAPPIPAPAGGPAIYGDPHEWLQYPHARREMLKECLFLAAPLLGAILGAIVVGSSGGDWPAAVRALGGVIMGYLAGGMVVWSIRILGTLGFGKEAMGLGDVHLMAAVGAVCGWEVAVLAFFVAPFFGLAWALLSVGWAKLMQRQVRMIPYGPHLAAATAVVCVFREWFVEYFGKLWLG